MMVKLNKSKHWRLILSFLMNKSTLGCYFIKLTLQSSISNINRYQTMLRSLKFNVIFYCDQSWRDNVKKMELFCGRQPIGKMVAWRCLSWITWVWVSYVYSKIIQHCIHWTWYSDWLFFSVVKCFFFVLVAKHTYSII
jgi:hypothetical protein